MVPGMGNMMRGVEIDQGQTEKSMKAIEAIILSMTPYERRNPRILNASRKRRVAAGSGTTVQEINQLLSQHRQMERMIKRLNQGKLKGMSGLFQ